jgi:hypothetical protein
MVQIIPARRDVLAEGLGKGLGAFAEALGTGVADRRKTKLAELAEAKKQEKENEFVKRTTGKDISGLPRAGRDEYFKALAKEEAQLGAFKSQFPELLQEEMEPRGAGNFAQGVVGEDVESLERPRQPQQLSPQKRTLLAKMYPEVEKSLQARDEAKRKEFEGEREYHLKTGAQDAIKGLEEKRNLIPNKEIAKQQVLQAAQDKDISGLSSDYLANLTGLEALRTQKGAQLLVGSKDLFLSNIGRVGARPNMWIEQQLRTMGTDLGRSIPANLTYALTQGAEIDIESARIEAIDALKDQYMREQGFIPNNIGSEANKIIRPQVEKIQDRLALQMRQLYDQEKGKKGLNRRLLDKVPSGTPLTPTTANLLVEKFGSTEKAIKEAEKLGYTFPSEELLMEVYGISE